MITSKEFDIVLKDNSDEVIAKLEGRIPIILKALGMTGVRFAKENTKEAGYIDTGAAQNSISYEVIGDSVYIGSNLEYFPYLELGTGAYASNGQGRKGWWVYVLNGDKNYEKKGEKRIYTEQEAKAIAAMLRAKGLEAYATDGIKPGHMIRDAITEHTKDFQEIINMGLEGL